MKIRHKINHGWSPDRTDPVWAERIEREAERHTDAAEKRYRDAEERLSRARAKLDAVESATIPNRSKIKRWRQIVEQRRQELNAIARLMQQSPAGSQHRGKGSYRGVS